MKMKRCGGFCIFRLRQPTIAVQSSHFVYIYQRITRYNIIRTRTMRHFRHNADARKDNDMKNKLLLLSLLTALCLTALPCAADETEEQPDPPLTGETQIVHEPEPSVIRRVTLDVGSVPETEADEETQPETADPTDPADDSADDGAGIETTVPADMSETEETLRTELGAIDPGPESDAQGGTAVLIGAAIAAAAAIGAVVVFRRGGTLDKGNAPSGDGTADDADADSPDTDITDSDDAASDSDATSNDNTESDGEKSNKSADVTAAGAAPNGVPVERTAAGGTEAEK